MGYWNQVIYRAAKQAAKDVRLERVPMSALIIGRVVLGIVLRSEFGHNLSRLHGTCVEEGLGLTRYPEAFFDFMDPDEPTEACYIRTGAKMAKPTVGLLEGVTAEFRDAGAQALKAEGEPVRWWNAGEH